MKGVISVIVPVYNMESYLRECIDSLICQTYTDLELIIVDDGSTDGSADICDEYAKIDSRIIVIHKENGGAASAKNMALRVATGEYLTFVDSDDYVERDALEYMYTRMTTLDADVIQCTFRNVYRNTSNEYIQMEASATFTVTEYLRRFTEDWTCGLHCAKLFKRSLYDGIFFEEGNKIDDEFFTYRGIMNASTVAYDPKVVYNYRQRGSSVMQSPADGQRRVMDRLSYLPTRRKAVIERYPELRRDFDMDFLDMMIFFAGNSFASEESLKRQKVLLKEYFKEKGVTHPPRAMWTGLFRLRFMPISWLMKRRKPAPAVNGGQMMFD